MSSLKQIEANRRNARKSTGPTTPEGKERSRCNAIRHGLTAETVVNGLEDAEDYQAFEAAITADYDAETAVERELVLRLASVLWRLRRATAIEAALFESVTAKSGAGEHDHPRLSLVRGTDLPENSQSPLGAARPSDAVATNEYILDAKEGIGSRFMRLAALPTFPLDRLSRCEYTLWGQARQIVFTLELFRHCRRSSRRSNVPFSFRRG